MKKRTGTPRNTYDYQRIKSDPWGKLMKSSNIYIKMTLICKEPKTNGRISYHAVKQFYQKNYIPLQKKPLSTLEYWVHSYNHSLNFSNYKTIITFNFIFSLYCKLLSNSPQETCLRRIMFKYRGFSVINYVCRLPQMTKHITKVSWNEIVTKEK